jgi:S1-C subfamily serine protease
MQQSSVLVVTEVLNESLVERSGVEFGDIIVSVEGNLVIKIIG